jgi:fatty-acyl-CoA synthase/long-chain acyl-CoA synthetase
VVTFAELEATANQGAQLFRSLGLQRGDHIAILLENHPRFFQICWAAQRSGIYFTAISWRLQQQEVDYIVNKLRSPGIYYLPCAQRGGGTAGGQDAHG